MCCFFKKDQLHLVLLSLQLQKFSQNQIFIQNSIYIHIQQQLQNIVF